MDVQLVSFNFSCRFCWFSWCDDWLTDMAAMSWSKNLEGGDLSEELGVGRNVTLKWMLGK